MDRITDDAELLAEDIAEEYLEHLHAGNAPDRTRWLTAHPHIAEVLNRHLSIIERIHRTAQESQAAALGADAAFGPDGAFGADGALGAGLPTPPPDHIGRYAILEVLGRGACGTVYHAYDPKFDRDVALKVLRPDLAADPQYGSRFRREARIAAQLRHPHIVPVHASGEEDGRLYLDMAFIPGASLEERLAAGPLSFAAAADLVEKLADALHYAHTKGIIHRDVKPSNILLNNDERETMNDESGGSAFIVHRSSFIVPLITDFGLARRAAGEASLTEHGQVIGTLAYMPPEQAQGGGHQADARSDVYGLGAVLYRMLTGRVPFPDDGSFVSQIHRIVHDEPKTPRSVNPAVPRDLETICLKAMAKEPKERFETAAAMADELRRWRKDESLTIRPPTWWEKTRRWARRNRAVANVTLAAAIVVLVVGGILGSLAWDQHKQRFESEAQKRAESAARAQVEYHSKLVQARQRILTPFVGRRVEAQQLLKSVNEPRAKMQDDAERDRLDLMARSLFAMSLGVPDFEIRKGDTAELPGLFTLIWPAALHPDGKFMMIGTNRGPIRWERGAVLKVPQDLDRDAARPQLVFSPNGQFLILAGPNGGVDLYDGDFSGTPTATWIAGKDKVVLGFGFESDRNTLWVCCTDGRVQNLTLPQLDEVSARNVQPEAEQIKCVVFCSDASHLAVGDEKGNIRIYEGSALTWVLPAVTGSMAVEALAFAPTSNGKRLAVGTRDGNLRLWDVERGEVAWRRAVSAYGVSSIQFDPSGTWVLAGFRGVGLKMWDAVSGDQILRLDKYVPMAFSRHGETLAGAYQDGVGFIDVIPPTIRRFTEQGAAVQRLAWSRSKPYLVSLDAAYEIRVRDVTDARLVRSFSAPRSDEFYADNARISISDDGGTVAYLSSGKQDAKACMYDVATGKVDAWPMPGAFEAIAFADGKFVAVREEFRDPAGGPRQTVLYEWEIGKKPKRLHVVRPSKPGDESGYYRSDLTPDGKFFCWSGPRKPEQNSRCEVREVATGNLVKVYAPDTSPAEKEFGGFVTPDGRAFYVGGPDNVVHKFDLANDTELRSLNYTPAFSEDMRWMSAPPSDEKLRWYPTLAICRPNDHRPWLEFVHSNPSPFGWAFYRDGRYLAWSDDSGGITVADTRDLQVRVDAFEQEYLSK